MMQKNNTLFVYQRLLNTIQKQPITYNKLWSNISRKQFPTTASQALFHTTSIASHNSASKLTSEPKAAPRTIYKNRIKDSLTVTAPISTSSSSTASTNRKHNNTPSIQHNTSNTAELEVNKSFFEDMFSKTKPEILEALKKEFKIEKPSSIQQLVLPELMKGNDVLCAAQTGTGKTLAYVVPMLYRMKHDEIHNKIETRVKRPKFIILVPSRELASQVASVVKKFSHYLKFRCICLRSDMETARMKRDLNSKVDVVVSTPGVFKKLHEKAALFYTDVRYVVVDEADTLLSKDFKQELSDNILIPFRDREVHNQKEEQRVQFCFVLATYNNEIQNYMLEQFPRMKTVAAPKLHHNHKNIVQKFLTIPGHDKIKHLDSTLGGETGSNRTIIFCNTVSSCRAVHHALTESGILSACYHSEIPPEKQAEQYDSFANGEVHIMVCTDIASRGLDIPNVKHVVMFDFPLNTVDYLHRVGRTGRFGASGRVTSLVNRPREIALAKEIERRIHAGISLDGVSSNPKSDITKSQKKAAAVAGQKERQKGKRALYWERHKMKERIKSAKMQSRGSSSASARRVKPIGSKSYSSVVDSISVRNPSTNPAKVNRSVTSTF